MLVETLGLTTATLYVRKRYKRKPLYQSLLPSIQRKTKADEARISVLSNTSTEQAALQHNSVRNISIAATSAGLATVGTLFYTPLALLSLPGIIYITYFSVAEAYRALVKDRKLTIDALASTTKVLLTINGYLFWASVSVTIYSINRYLLAKISDTSRKDLIDVFRQVPKTTWIVYSGTEKEVLVDTLKANDIIVVSVGSAIPVDGLIVKGSATVDQQLLTGEAQPAEKHHGDTVFAMTSVLSGKLYIRVTKAGNETTAAQITSILNSTIDSKTEAQLWSRKITDKSVIPTLVLSGASYPLLGPGTALAIMNSHFNYRAIISSTIGVMKYLKMALSHGLMIKDGRTFEALSKVDTVVFDKTGTLTEEQPNVGIIYAQSGYSKQDIVGLAAAAEARQSHPIAKAIVQKAQEWGVVLPTVTDFDYKLGYGLSVKLGETVIRVGSLRFLEEHNITVPTGILTMQTQCHNNGSSTVLVAIEHIAVGAIELQPSLRQGTEEILQTLHKHGIQSTYIISGDHDAPTRALAKKLNMDGYFAETLPEQKAELIAQLQAKGKHICYIGDGINDALALQQANVAISLRGASTVATDKAEVILLDKTLEKLPLLLDMAQQFDRHIKKVVTVVAVPSIVSAGSAIVFVSTGLTGSFILPLVGLAGGLTLAMRPPPFSKSSVPCPIKRG